ncbi:MAG: HAD family hydrolase [Polyangiaceae bacterium]|nr:HAD family hydrolase [Polyangiaceae bacterium]
MGELRAATPLPARPSQGPAGTVPCSTCGNPVDPLRAARVAYFGTRFRYFCSSPCREAFAVDPRLTPLPIPRHRTPGVLDPSAVLAIRQDADGFEQRKHAAEALADVGADELSHLDSPPAAIGPAELEDDPGTSAPVTGGGPPPDVGGLLLALAMLGGGLAVALTLAGDTGVALHARALLAGVAAGALVFERVLGRPDPTLASPLALLAAPIGGVIVASAAILHARPEAPAAVTLAAVVVVTLAAGMWLMRHARRPQEAERLRIATALDGNAHRVVSDSIVPTLARELRPGEEIVVGPGEVVPVDATVVAGSVEVTPWYRARGAALRGEGESLVAGACVKEGRVRAVVGWAGHDRAWLRLTNDPRRRADLIAPLARFGRLAAERGAPLAALLASLAAFAGTPNLIEVAMVAVGAYAALANAGLAQIGSLHVGRSVLAALQRGVVFRTADALDQTGKVSTTVFCARGTLLLGEPEIASIEAFGDHDAEMVLALVAGAESGAVHPVAAAVVRAARGRGVRPDGVRSPTLQPGLGVTAIASNGQPLVVGNRALMLREHISVARAESRINELEALGRSVMLVALAGRLAGLLGLQDGLRSGARAAVQHLLDVGVEPVLLSGDARETCEALGRALDVEHIRPEVLPQERGDEVKRLADGGAVIAVVGRSPIDDAALAAGQVSVALGAAGSSAAEWSVQLTNDDVRDAALAIRLAHECRQEARLGLVLTMAAGIVGALAVGFDLAPPLTAPLLALAGTLAAYWRLRSIET